MYCLHTSYFKAAVACVHYIIFRLLEMVVQAALTDLKENQQSNFKYIENAVEVVRIAYDFLVARHGEFEEEKRSSSLLENLMDMLDCLAVWEDQVLIRNGSILLFPPKMFQLIL